MTVKYTQEFIKQECKKKGYILFNEYINNRTKLFLYDNEGYIYTTTWDSLKQNKHPSKFHKSNPYTIQNIKRFIELNAKGYKIISDKYINNNKKLLFKCPEGHEFEMSLTHFKQGQRCPKCSHQQPSEETVIYNSESWMMGVGVNEEDAKKYLPQSSKYIEVICPNCGKTKKIQISQIYQTKSIGCSCGDGISYPEKFVISLLDQLNIKYEHDNYYIENKRYDFYLPDLNCIIECHGEQHYKYTGRGRILEEEQNNDQYKKELALDNGIINYVVLDCRESDVNWIKNSILNSKLNDMFNLSNSNIDWVKCEEFALSNIVKQVCDYWNNNKEEETLVNIENVFGLTRSTICRYLRKGNKLNWCNYNGKEQMSKNAIKSSESTRKSVEIFKDGKSLGIFPSYSELSRQSEELFGVKLLQSSISLTCLGKQKQHKGFTFKYVDKQN